MFITNMNLHPLPENQDITPPQSLHDLEYLTEVLNVGDYLSTPLGPETYVFEVTHVTPRIAHLCLTMETFMGHTDDPDTMREQKRGVVWAEVYSDENCTLTRTVHINHDGVLNKSTSDHPDAVFSKCMLVSGKPVKRIEYAA